ncbi:DNA-binding response regulator [Photobacterium profundum]|uniref:Putaive two-component response regulator n=1 Tax=Photobacterium profundum 3TCK TaxID=314280 RepID=Q1Z6K0_9GAMM|nr:response regulator transcription factor [Photobacterium profundum]EAS44147.1 putaive two-component response regulator [Photobacterium profundum 3TCK]PSV59849.1 DNA-binding response regulator [Photobacterium profundum]
MLKNKQVLVVEDNEELQGILADFLEVKGADVDFADNGELGLKLALENDFDAIILDVMMPKKDGMQVAKELRENGCTTPILMLTALNGREDLLKGFERGIDDFVTKPFNFPELEVRLSALIKRYRGDVANSHLEFGSLTIDQRSHKVTREGHQLLVTPVMYQILVKLTKVAPEMVSRDVLIHEVWGEDAPDKDILRSHIYLLRNVLDKPFKKPMLITVPKFGFRLEG